MTQAFNKACNEYADAMKSIREVCIKTLTEICNRRDDKIINLTKFKKYCRWIGVGYPVIEYDDRYSVVECFYIRNNRIVFDIEWDESYVYETQVSTDDLINLCDTILNYYEKDGYTLGVDDYGDNE
jgi:hypothetical protein